MRAAVRTFGGICFLQEYKKPECGSKEILVKVKSAAINPVDYKIGRVIGGPIVGIDFSGVIIEIGQKVDSNFEIGNEVYGSAKGSLAEYATVLPGRISLKPKSISFSHAAAMNITYMTSLQGIRNFGKLPKGGRILIIGASGGCGTAAIQLSQFLGAKDIIAVCSEKNEEFVKSLGATDAIDYTKSDLGSFFENSEGFVDEVNKFDVIYDAASYSGAGEDYKDISLKLLKKDNTGNNCGQYVAINGSPGMWLQALTVGFRGNQHLFVMKANTEDLETLAKLTDEGWTDDNGNLHKLQPIIAETFEFTEENIKKGFELLKSRRVKGKIIFNV